jgi:glutaredoxin
MTQRTKPPQKTAIVWTNTENRDGIKAAALLRRTGAKVEVRDIDSGKWKKSDVEASVPGYTTLPQIVVDGAVVGDLAAVKSHPKLGAKLKKPKLDHAARTAKAAENKTTWMNNKKAAAAERAVAAKSVVKGRLNHPTEEQKTVALARAVAAKAARAEHAAARVVAIKAARPARG